MSRGSELPAFRRRIPIAYLIDDCRGGGGTEKQFQHLLSRLDRERFEPHVFNLGPRGEAAPADLGCPQFFLGVEKLASAACLRAAHRFSRYLREQRIRILQIVFIDSRIFGTVPGRLAGVEQVVFARREMGWWYTPSKLHLMRLLATLSDHCLVNAEAIKQLVTRTEDFPENRITVIPNGVELQPVIEGGTALRRSLGVPEGACLVGIIANLRPVKRLDLFIEMAAAVSDRQVHFLVVGSGSLLDELRGRAAEKGLAGRLHFHQTRGGIGDVLEALDVGVLTSASEGLSNVLIEYALAGIPAVAFGVGGNREVIAPGRTGSIVPDGDVRALTAAVEELIAKPALRQELGRQARADARERFSVERMVRQTEALYLRLIREDSGPGSG